MKYINFILFLLFANSCNSQTENTKFDLERLINENTKTIEYEGVKYTSNFEIDIERAIIVYTSPMVSFVGKKYSKNRNQIKVMPISNLHPKGMYYDPEKKLVKIYARENKPGFFDNISSNDKLRWSNNEYDSDVCSIEMNANYNSEKYKELENIYNSYIQSENSFIRSEEEPPKEGFSRPEFENYRDRILNLKSELEETDFVLSINTVTTKPRIKSLNYQESLRFFEYEMKKSLEEEKIFLDGNLRGFLLIDTGGKVIEVLQEESSSNYTKKNNRFEELALKFKDWIPAEFKSKPVICKIKYYIQKEDWD